MDRHKLKTNIYIFFSLAITWTSWKQGYISITNRDTITDLDLYLKELLFLNFVFIICILKF